MKKKLCISLVFALVLSLFGGVQRPVSVEAAVAKKLTLYVGSTYEVPSYYYSSASSSKKSVASVKKGSYGGYVISAQKPGTATIKLKSSYGYSDKYKVTVKSYFCPITFYLGANVDNKKATSSSDDDDDYYYSYSTPSTSEVIMAVSNKTTQSFDTLKISYKICNKAGDELAKGTAEANCVLKNTTAYVSVSLPSGVKLASVDTDKCSAEITGSTFSPDYKYVDKSGSVTTDITESTYSSSQSWDMTVKNKSKKYLEGMVYVLLFSNTDKIIGVKSERVYVYQKSSSEEYFDLDMDNYPEYSYRRVIPVFYYTKAK